MKLPILMLVVTIAGGTNFRMDFSKCQRRFVQVQVKFHNCLRTRVVTRACSGACPSYTSTSSMNPSTLEHTCSCCRDASRKRKRYAMWCPNRKSSKLIKMVLSISVPTSCMCRPCSVLPNHIISSEKITFGRRPNFIYGGRNIHMGKRNDEVLDKNDMYQVDDANSSLPAQDINSPFRQASVDWQHV